MFDIIIIGGGPAGISAGIYAVSRGKKTLIIEKNKIGGMIGKVSTVTHYSAIIPDETGETFAKRLEDQARGAGVEIVYEDVQDVKLEGDVKEVKTDKNTYECSKIIIATGTTPVMLGIPGEVELCGKGMRMNAAKDGKNYAGKNVYVVGGADGAVKEALYLAKLAKKVTIIHFEDKLGCIPEFKNKVEASDNIEVLTSSRLNAVHGTDHVESLDILNVDDNSIRTIEDPGCGIFVYAGGTPNSGMFKGVELHGDFIKVDNHMMTNIDGVYAVGDVRLKQVKQVATAVADGAIAGINAAM